MAACYIFLKYWPIDTMENGLFADYALDRNVLAN